MASLVRGPLGALPQRGALVVVIGLLLVISAVSGAIAQEGGVVTWGYNYGGQRDVPPEAESGITAIAGGYQHSLALTAEGRVLAWGLNWRGQCDVPEEAESGIIAIAGGEQHTLAVTHEGRVIAWGYDLWGQCTVPQDAESGGVAVSAGVGHSLALTTEGRVIAWGRNFNGQCGIPQEAESGVIAIAAGYQHSLALTTEGAVIAWGDHQFGQCDVPADAASGIQAIAAGWYHSLALRTPNEAPVADAGPDQLIEGTGPTTAFTVDGTGSWDPDGDPLSYSWEDADGNVVGADATVALDRAVGEYPFTLTVTDPGDLSSSDAVIIWIRDTTPPTIVPPPDVEIAESDPLGTPVDLGWPEVSDNCDPDPTVENDAAALFPLGVTTVTWMATDAAGNSATAEQTVTVVPGSPGNQLANLRELILYSIASGDIAPEMEESLLAKVDAAIAALDRGDPPGVKLVLNDLKALVNQVEAQTDKKIETATAAEIIARANLIIAALGA